jgi:hypothetical protein
VIAASPNGEKLGAATQLGATGQITKVTGAAFTLPDGNSAVVYAGDDGLPVKAVFSDVVVIFSGYTNNTVNIEAVAANGTVTTARNVSIDATLLADLKSLPAQLSAAGGDRPAALGSATHLALALKIAGTLVSVAGCVAAGSSVLASVGASSIIAIGSCTSAVVKVLTLIDPSLDSSLLFGSSVLMSAATCATGSPWGCSGVVLSALRAAESLAQGRLSSVPPSTPVSTRRFVVSETTLYLSDFTATGADIPIGAITTANRNPVSVTDIAITPDGKAYVLSFTNLYSLNTATATVTPIGSGTLSTINALASDSAGNLWGASVADGSLYRIDRNSGSTSLAGRFGANWVSSGDLAFDSDGTLWAAVHRTTDTSDTLATVNTATGAATPRGTFMPYGIFGLIFANNTLYGLSYSTNSLYVVNTTSGMATFVRTLSFSPYGTSRKR